MKLLFAFLTVLLVACTSNSPSGKKSKKAEVEEVSESQIEDTLEVDEEKTPYPSMRSYEKLHSSISADVELERMVFEWPSDDALCDIYSGSDGPMTLIFYRIKESKKIIFVSETGAYCQGDSDYQYQYRFDLNGNAVSSYYSLLYSPDEFTFYEEGKAVLKVEYPAFSEAPDIYDAPPILVPMKSDEVITTERFEKLLITYKARLNERLKGLKDFPSYEDIQDQELVDQYKKNESMMKERTERLVVLQKIIDSTDTYVDGTDFYRMPLTNVKGWGEERLILNSMDVKVFKSPSFTSEVIDVFSYYDSGLYADKAGETETIAPYGTHTWYRVKRFYDRSEPPFEGWIFGAFVAKDFYLW